MRRKSKRRLGQQILIGALSAVILIIGITVGWFYMTYMKASPKVNNTIELPSPTPGERVNILLIGVDARPGELTSRSDTIIFISIDPSIPEVFLLSIPRDCLVEIPGYGEDKVNAAHAYGGISLLAETVSLLLNRTIHYYAEINFEGFAKVIDILGGVDFNVEDRMYYPWEGIDLYPGLQHLNGEQSLAYVRYRDYPEGDIARVHKQQKFFASIIEQHFTWQNVMKIPSIFNEIASCMETNIPIEKAIEIARSLGELKMNQVRLEVVPGNFLDINDISFWGIDKPALDKLMQSLEEPWALEETSTAFPEVSEGP